MSARSFFPDNTVLCNFAAVGQLSLLEKVLDGQGRWSEAVAFEAAKSSATYPDLQSVADSGWLGQAIEIDDDIEVRQVEGLRRAVFGGSSAKPTQHLGEAQTIHLITRRAEFDGAVWISDDQESLRYARLQMIATKETMNLVAEAVQVGWCTAASGFSMLNQMVAAGQNPRLPASALELNSI